jgi:hypothetical protein
MKVKYLIEQLKKYNADETIVVNWWDKQWFSDFTTEYITDEQWDNIVMSADEILDTTEPGEQLLAAARKNLYQYDNRDNA